MLLVNLILNVSTPTSKPVWLIVSKLYLGKFDETTSPDLYLLHDRFSSFLPPTVSEEVKRTYSLCDAFVKRCRIIAEYELG